MKKNPSIVMDLSNSISSTVLSDRIVLYFNHEKNVYSFTCREVKYKILFG